jgi:hypothetical protein
MTRSETNAGTPVVKMTAEEYQGFLEDEVQRRLQMSVRDFERRYRAAELDDSDPDVPWLAVLTGVGQGDHRVAA